MAFKLFLFYAVQRVIYAYTFRPMYSNELVETVGRGGEIETEKGSVGRKETEKREKREGEKGWEGKHTQRQTERDREEGRSKGQL